jgi:putative ABC transport system permease protein
MAGLLHDLRQAARALAKRPSFTAVAVLTLGLGMGATTALFSVVDAVLLRPLPYRDTDQLVVLWQQDMRKAGPLVEIAWKDYETWRTEARAFEALALMTATNFRVNLSGRGEPAQAEGALVSGNFFDLLGVPLLRGRAFLPEEDTPGAPTVAVMSYGLWQRQFGGDPKIVGTSVTMDGSPATVIGVTPPDFALPRSAELWFSAAAAVSKDVPELRIFKAVGRLPARASLAAAQADMTRVSAALESREPKRNRGLGAVVVTLQKQIFGQGREALLLLMGAVACVLLIACANVANLLLARGHDREHEIAVRAALGASRWRLARQLLAESLLLGLAGGALGVFVAVMGVSSLVRLIPAALPHLDHVGVDARVLTFALVVSLFTALAFGTLPALRASQARPGGSMRDTGTRASESVRGVRVRGALVVSEIALSLVLLAGAGLMVRSFAHVVALAPGFDPRGVVTARLNLGDKHQGVEGRAAYFGPLLQRIQALPGVTSAGLVLLRPLKEPIGWDYSFTVEGQGQEAFESNPPVNHEAISPDYFRTLRIPLLKGRTFSEADGPKAEPVVIVSRGFAERYWPGRDPLGQRLKFGPPDGKAVWKTVVGVVGDVRYREWTSVWLDAYVPYTQWSFGRMDLVVGTEGDPLALVPALRAAVQAGDKDLALASVTTMEDAVFEAVAGPRFSAMLLGVFAGLALLLAAVGLYGVMAWSVSRRRREIGIRMALGARAGDVLRLVMRDGLRLAVLGLALGLAGAFAAGRMLQALLYEVSPAHPPTLLQVALLLLLVAGLAAYLPARRAARVDPLTALHYE